MLPSVKTTLRQSTSHKPAVNIPQINAPHSIKDGLSLLIYIPV